MTLHRSTDTSWLSSDSQRHIESCVKSYTLLAGHPSYAARLPCIPAMLGIGNSLIADPSRWMPPESDGQVASIKYAHGLAPLAGKPKCGESGVQSRVDFLISLLHK